MKKVILLFVLLTSTRVYAKECSPLLDFDVRSLNENTMVNMFPPMLTFT